MKKLVSILMAVIILATMVPVAAYCATPDGVDNQQHVERDAEIAELQEERRKILMEDTVDLVRLNAVEIQLHELGVDFLSSDDVAERFPEAFAALEGNNQSEASSSGVEPRVAVPSSNVNSWMSYETNNYTYNGTAYNIQRLYAEPRGSSSGSPLWEENEARVNFNYDWVAGTTNLLEVGATTLAGQVAPITMTVYDALVSTWNAIKPVTILDVSDVLYSWECSTTVVFYYVCPADESDYYEALSHVSSSCSVAVGYIVDVEKYKLDENGDEVELPAVKSDSRTFYRTSPYYGSPSYACYAYENNFNLPTSTCVRYVEISGPESKVVVEIDICCPSYPIQCE